jgi:cytochrome P450
VTVTAPDGVYYDPYDVQINTDPYLAFRGRREEAPLYYNEQHDFYALSRFADVDRAIVDHETFSSTVRGWEAMPAVLG